jgi:mono/diheme cytochrome c family protein
MRLCVRSLLRSSVAGGLFASTLALALWSPWQAPAVARAQQRMDMKNPYEGQVEAIEKGRDRFSERCTFCHGTRGKGAKGPCLICGHWKHGGSNASLFVTISAGLAGTQMGAFAASLTGDEIWQIIAFLRDEEAKRRQAQAQDEGGQK